jgi:dihydrofolate synthase / folylpolyglutamate synthase
MQVEECMKSREALEAFLYSLRHGGRYALDSMERLMKALGDPQKRYLAIHVAGTNGKGSVCAFLESIYRHASYKVGMYTSPHLVAIEERIQINRELIHWERLALYCQKIQKAVDENGLEIPSFFEWMTAIAFLYFADEAVDIGIFEVGIGGRLDATNVLDSAISVITSIGLDHVELLGNTTREIAQEKGGIIKPWKPVVLGNLDEESEEVIRKIAMALKSTVHTVHERFGDDINDYPVTSLEGDHQRENAAVARLTCEILRNQVFVGDDAIENGLKNASWDGRWQRISLKNSVRLILDGTHNELGMIYLEQLLKKWIKHHHEKLIIVVGVLGEFRAKSLIPKLAKYASEFIFVRPNSEKALDGSVLRTLIPPYFKGSVRDGNVPELFSSKGFLANPHEPTTILVTGSLYLVGDVLKVIDGVDFKRRVRCASLSMPSRTTVRSQFSGPHQV